ncbi:MAG: ABC transporter ATP-binding protein [Frankia sp.]
MEAVGLTKRYGGTVAVDGLSFTVSPGRVTGFLGPNGAGKSTTMRLLLGLERPDAGSAAINGVGYAELTAPLTQVGAMLEAKAFHPGRSGRNHLLCLAQSHALAPRRVEEVIDLVGLRSAAGRRAGTYSLGMAQRLGIAAALLADPGVVILDEPVNGLDPEGVLWIRNLMKRLAGEGRAVLVSSHLMNEMAVTADHLLVIGRGRLLSDCPTDEFIRRHTDPEIYAVTPAIARPALLEEAFMRVTAASVEYATR